MRSLRRAVESPLEAAGGGTGLVNGLIYVAVAFGWVHWNAEQIAGAGFAGNVIVAVITYFWLKRTTTSRAKPTTTEGMSLVPIVPVTRGIPKGK